ncbi:hypothetical protein RTBOTA2_005813 [Rhodotorula toruloides]|uniref:Uncharacterized protein n=1 Tax=Rhodotorula toruloides TaxID=5286 RepID=A0A0K3CQG0_RHOTO|nr:hypothetical protein RTBOTA2_005813 [Rhodotorula toruloides]PRQ72109.1 hypothetical protein AAT19DRAFT_9448 [Rhodotorula toruloides]
MSFVDSYAQAQGPHSQKARFRPGKAPAPAHARPEMKRTASLVSLPSPPAEGAAYDEDGMDLDGGSEDAPRRNPLVQAEGFDQDDEEVDQLDSDLEEDDSASKPPQSKRTCLLGSPANFLGGPAAGPASRKQLLNPFLPGAAASTSFPSHAGAPPSPSASPVRPPHPSPSRRRHRPDPDRIKLATTPPPKSRAELEKQAQEEKKRQMGWFDEDNPFVERDDEMARRLKDRQPLKRPETITYVKRGQRVQTTIPFSALLTSTSPSEDPFTFTTPKLLFPPRNPPSPTPEDSTHPTTPPKQSKFLEALRNAGKADEAKEGRKEALPPTPATLKRRAPGGAAAADEASRYGPYKRMRGLEMSGVGEKRGLR